MNHVHGGDIYSKPNMLDFSANINPLGMPIAVMDAAKRGVELAFHYPDVACRELTEGIGRNYGIDSEAVICGNGAAELIFSICLAEKPKKALLVAPGFAEYEMAIRSVDCEISYYFLKEEENFKVLDDYLSYVTDDLDMIFLCNPNNPTGQMIKKEMLLKIAKVCKKKRIRMVLDECFIGFSTRLSENSMLDQLMKYENLVILNAFTKLYAMPGLRLGYALSMDTSLLKRMKQVVQPWSVSLPAQLGGIAALKEKEYVRRTRQRIACEKEFLLEGLSLEQMSFEQGRHGLIEKIYGYEANYIFFRGNKHLSEFLNTQGIQIRDCSNYVGLEQGYYRIGIRNREDNNKLLKALCLGEKEINQWQK